MFCHVCGAKLADGARFCSFCGTSVPAEILEQAAAAAPSAPPAAAAAPVVPAAAPAETTAAPEPPAPPAAPAAEPAPSPAASLEPAPMIRPTPTPIESVPPEIVTIEVTVSEEQIRGGDSILIDDLRLASPLQLALRPGMKDGTRMRLQNAVFRDSGSGAPKELVVRLNVPEPEYAPSYAEPVYQPRPEPEVTPPPAAPRAPAYSYTDDGVLVSDAQCGFFLGQPGKLDGYHWGGDDTGYAQIRRSGLSLTKKSKLVAAATGAIGSMIEWKGKDFLTLSRADVLSYRKTDRKKLTVYYISLASGQALKLYFVGDQLPEKNAALETFLNG